MKSRRKNRVINLEKYFFSANSGAFRKKQLKPGVIKPTRSDFSILSDDASVYHYLILTIVNQLSSAIDKLEKKVLEIGGKKSLKSINSIVFLVRASAMILSSQLCLNTEQKTASSANESFNCRKLLRWLLIVARLLLHLLSPFSEQWEINNRTLTQIFHFHSGFPCSTALYLALLLCMMMMITTTTLPNQ